MDINEAFQADTIEQAGTNTTEAEDDAIRLVINQVYDNAEEMPRPVDLQAGVLCFVAGRTYESDQHGVTIDGPTLDLFIKFLVQRAS